MGVLARGSRLDRYLRWTIAGILRGGLKYLFFLLVYHYTENIHLAFWSWILMAPINYHIWDCIRHWGEGGH